MFELIKANKRRSALLIASFVILLSLVGAAFGLLLGAGPWGAIIALVFSGAMAFASYWKADSIALAVSRAKPADPQQYQRLHNLVEGLCIAAGLPKPQRLHRRRSGAQRVRHGPQPEARCHRCHHRPAREDEPGRARRCDRPRAVARAQLRHPRLDPCRHAGRLHRPAHQLRHADDVVERRPCSPVWRPRWWQPDRPARPGVADLCARSSPRRCRLRSVAAGRRWQM